MVFEDCLPGPDDILDIDMEVTSLTVVKDANGNQVVTGSDVFDNYFYTQADFIGGGVIENVKLPIEGSFEINVTVTQENCSTCCLAINCEIDAEIGGKPQWKGSSGVVEFKPIYVITMKLIRCKCCN